MTHEHLRLPMQRLSDCSNRPKCKRTIDPYTWHQGLRKTSTLVRKENSDTNQNRKQKQWSKQETNNRQTGRKKTLHLCYTVWRNFVRYRNMIEYFNSLINKIISRNRNIYFYFTITNRKKHNSVSENVQLQIKLKP